MPSNVETSTALADRPRRRLRPLRRGFLLAFLTMLVLAIGQSDFRPTELESAMAPHRYSILQWELGHLSHKWLHSLSLLLPGQHDLTDVERAEMVAEFFDLGLAQRRMESRLRQAEMGGEGNPKAGTLLHPCPEHPTCEKQWPRTRRGGKSFCPTSSIPWKKR